MKITLKNFRCYDDRSFNFGDNGLVLLTGASGLGKSTIMMAIQFALFGTGTKVAKHGSLSCSVELEFDGIKIMRTKRPNRVVVNDIYEDDVGQDIINKKFGDTFDTTGYISQNALNSFILMSPQDKLVFFEKFAFKDVDLSQIKTRCKAYINDRHNILTGTISQLELATQFFNELIEPTPLSFPIKCKASQQDKAIKNENIKHKNCIISLKKIKNTISSSKEELGDLRVLMASIHANEENLFIINRKLSSISIDELNSLYKGEDKLKEYKSLLNTIVSLRDIKNLKKSLSDNVEKLNEMKDREIKEYNGNLKDINENLWKEYNKEEIKELINDTKKYLFDMEKVSNLEKEIKQVGIVIDIENLNDKKEKLEKYRIDLEEKKRVLNYLKIQQELYECPSCQKKLRFKNNNLYLENDISTIETEVDIDSLKNIINELQNKIRTLERIIPEEENKIQRKNEIETNINKILSKYEEIREIEELQEDIEYLKNYLSTQTMLENKKSILENALKEEKFSSSYLSFERTVLRQREELEELEKGLDDVNDNLSEEELRKIIEDQQQYKNNFFELKKQKNELEEEKKVCETKIKKLKSNYIEKYNEIKNEDELLNVIKENEEKIVELEEKKVLYEEILQKISEYNKYEEENKNYLSWKTKVEKLVLKEKEDREKYASSTLLRDKILEAESIAMYNIIQSVNTHAQLYLDSFFVENPILIRLLPFKETKKNTKPQINLEIDYKGMECDLNMLSGGELSRVILAFTLALGEMFNTPLLLLDECTSSLDQNLTTVVFNAIREHYNGKLVILIAHQVVTGIFDKTINLSNEEFY